MGQFVDHWDQARCLKLCLCVSLCLFSLSMCCLSQCVTISDLVASVPDKASSGKAGWESFGNWAPFKTSTWTNAAIPNLCSAYSHARKKGLDYSGQKPAFSVAYSFLMCRPCWE